MKKIYYYQTDIGRVALAEQDERIINLYFEGDFIPIEQYTSKETDILRISHKQLQEYLRGERIKFHLPLAPTGTSFYKTVWNCLQNIPYGTTRSYREIAEQSGNKKAWRAVGNANNKNPIPIFIPCHRVISTQGRLAGYRGGLQMKTYLLELEKNNKK
ncbi:MAG: cysteine methyltransferase [Firmicutes bacterium HGW-Firmicutes-12]|nr:MAG: cysteine methyltransferase [Firmicutes bacterium HGW-Firmicutes-12]